MSTPSFLLVPDRYKAAKLYSQLPEDGSGDLVVTRATTAIRTNANGILESVAANVPRLDYPVGGGCPSLLIEPAATNLVLRSEEFNNASWVPQGLGVASIPIVTANAGVAPDGTTTADRIQLDCINTSSSANRSRLIQNITIANTTAYTGSIWIKAFDAGNVGRTVRISTGAVNAATFTLTANWQRVTYTGTSVATAGDFIIETRGTLTTQTADLLIWGAQLETGSVATSYIPTAGTIQTRNADVISLTGASALIGQAQGTLYAEVDTRVTGLGAAGLGKRILCLTDGTVSNRIEINKGNTDPIEGIVVSGGVNQAIITTSNNQSGIFKIALAYALNDVVMYVNGIQVGIDTSVNIPATSVINLGQRNSGDGIFNDRIRAAALYTQRLPNAELASLTTL